MDQSQKPTILYNQSLLLEYKKVIDVSNIVSKTDINWIITYVNQEFCNISWFTQEELIWKPHNIVRHPDMPKDIFKDLWNTIKAKKVWHGIVKNKTKTWWYYWVKSTISPVINEQWNVIEYISVRTDITEFKDMQKYFEWYEQAINIANYVIKLTPSWQITYANSQFCNAMNYTLEELIWQILLYKKTKQNDPTITFVVESSEDALQEKIKKSKIWKGLIKYKTKLWDYIYCKTTIVPVLNSNEDISEFIILQTDITQVEITKQQVKDSYDKLKELDEKKDEFLHIVSHDLRTPISVSQWYISLLTEWVMWKINDEAKDVLLRISKTNERLLTMINDLLDSSKLESWKYEFNLESTDLNNILDDIYFENNSLAMKKNITFEIIKDKDEYIITTDINKLKQVFINLIWNAIKFTPENWKVTVWYNCTNKDYTIYIKDTGMWIPKEYKDKIFEKFWQIKTEQTKHIEWTGLGLAIVKMIVSTLWGSILVESEVWEWSTFFLKFDSNH